MKHKSSHIARSNYDPSSGCLDVTFNNGKTYRYSEVDPRTAQRLQSTNSPGSYLRAHIAGKHKSTILPDED